LEYFYGLGIIYRDIKPENFIVDMKGYLKLIDLGTAKVIKMKNPLQAKTYTIIGTPYYMAPEIIAAKGYNFTVDLYSLGVCLF
jgi:cGMP-dependent protein kinase